MIETMSDGGAAMLLTMFSIQESYFAVDALRVQEIIRLGAITPVHHAPDYVLGIINLRGRIVTVLDPGCRLGLGAQELQPQGRILIVDWQDEQVGLLVTRIHDMVTLEIDQLTEPPSNLKGSLGLFLQGVVQIRDHMVAVLNLEPLLTVEEAHS